MNKEWIKAAAVRAIKTMAQGAIALIGSDMVSIIEINGPQILGCVATMGLLSILTSIAGLPAVDDTVEVIQYDDETDGDDVREVLDKEDEDE